MLRAQQLHPESQKLYAIFFQIALENKSQADEEIALKLADIVYANGKKKFTNASFYIEMLNIVDKFSYAASIQLQILEDIQTMFEIDELVWHTLAQRQLNGLRSVELIKSEEEENKSNENTGFRVSEELPLKKRIELCQQIYEKALQTVCRWLNCNFGFCFQIF